jgi:hypothetical protein
MRLRLAAIALTIVGACLVTASATEAAPERRAAATPVPVAGPRTATTATPAPRILPFARKLTGARRAPKPSRTTVKIEEGYDGCDHAYGDRGQCVPWRFPARARSGCAWLKAHGFAALAVHGRDRHRLDANRDGIACGPDD